MNPGNAYFIVGNAYAGKSTMVRRLAGRYDGIACGENYQDQLLDGLDSREFPCLTYTRDLRDWRDFIRRSPEEYAAWVDGAAAECEKLELRILDGATERGRPVFVDTNISLETLGRIADRDHVLVMLADPEISVSRFFDRPDAEKQFLYRLLMREPDPDRAMENYRQGLRRINSREKYDRFLHSGYNVLLRDEGRSVEQTLALAERAFGLEPKRAGGARVRRVEKGTALAEELLAFVENCSWAEAKRHIAEMIGNWAFADWETMFAAVAGGRIVGMASAMKTDYYPLPEVFPWVSCVYVTEAYRGQRISGELIACANRYLKRLGFERSYIPSEFKGLYERYGYRYLRDIVNYGGGRDHLFVKELG